MLTMSHTGDPEKLIKVTLLNILLQSAGEDKTLRFPSALFVVLQYKKISPNLCQ